MAEDAVQLVGLVFAGVVGQDKRKFMETVCGNGSRDLAEDLIVGPERDLERATN